MVKINQKGFAPILIVLLIAILGMAGAYYLGNLQGKGISILPKGEKACTLEVMICPDGSSVGRSGPNCEFVSCPSTSPTGTPNVSDVWKTYTSSRYNLEFQYPSDWKIIENSYNHFLQIQRDGIVGSISVLNKKSLDSNNAMYPKMYNATAICPAEAGRIDNSGPSELAVNVYCLNGQNFKTQIGAWKGAVECGVTSWESGSDFNKCPHQFWLNANNFFVNVHFNIFDSNNMEEKTFAEKFLSSFRFTN